MLICLLKAPFLARKQLLPYLYHPVLFLGEVAQYLMNCFVKTCSQRCLICGQTNTLRMAILKWQRTLWVKGQNTNPSQGMQGLHHWTRMENMCEKMLSEATASFLCIKGVVIPSKHLDVDFPVLSPWGRASLGYSLERSVSPSQLLDPLHVKEDPLCSFPSGLLCCSSAKSNLLSQGIDTGGEGSPLTYAVLHAGTLHVLPCGLQRWQLCAN